MCVGFLCPLSNKSLSLRVFGVMYLKKYSMFKKNWSSFVLACLCALPIFCHAQSHEVGLAGGIANYRGDMSPIINALQPGVHGLFFYRYNANKVWSIRANAGLGQIRCADSKSNDLIAQARSHEFLTSVVEFSGQIEYNFLNFGKGTPRKPHLFSPYSFLGFGMFKLDPIRNVTPTYSSWARCVPMGLGFKWKISNNVRCSTEFGARFTSTDYLDDLGLNTGSATQTTNPKLQGNPNTKDMYFFTNISLSYVFWNKKDDCPRPF